MRVRSSIANKISSTPTLLQSLSFHVLKGKNCALIQFSCLCFSVTRECLHITTTESLQELSCDSKSVTGIRLSSVHSPFRCPSSPCQTARVFPGICWDSRWPCRCRSRWSARQVRPADRADTELVCRGHLRVTWPTSREIRQSTLTHRIYNWLTPMDH